MLGEGSLTFKEFVMNEALPLSTIQDGILEFLRGRQDAVLFGALAVNAYVDEPRMTQDVDILSPRADALAEELREHLSARFHIAVRIRTAETQGAFRLYQLREPRNRHLADIRNVETLPSANQIEGLSVLAPDALIASKVVSYHQRRGRPKAETDWRDVAELLLKFPALKTDSGAVAAHLRAVGVPPAVMATWEEIVKQRIDPEVDEGF
jgi:hypothetical protein